MIVLQNAPFSMSRTHLRSFSRPELRLDGDSISSQGNDSSDTLHYSAENLLRKSPEGT